MTSKWLALFAAIGAALCLAQAQTSTAASTEKVLTVSKTVGSRQLVKADIGALDKIFADTYIDGDEGGHRGTKSELLAVLKSGQPKLISINLSDLKVYAYGGFAVVTGAVASQRTPAPAK